MIYYYTNRELSKKLEVNLARWKRWSRSFLPPDPLGGLQSGYARQYIFKDLFKVYLGGYLLSHLKLSVMQSRQVLDDLSPWLKKNGILDLNGADGTVAEMGAQWGGYRIYFRPLGTASVKNGSNFCYLVRKTVRIRSEAMATCLQLTETVEETIINADAMDGSIFFRDPDVRLINLSPLLAVLVEKLRRQQH